MLGLDLCHITINKWNPISFDLAFRLEHFWLAHPIYGYYIFMFIVFSKNPSALFYMVWIHQMEAKQYGIKNLVVI